MSLIELKHLTDFEKEGIQNHLKIIRENPLYDPKAQEIYENWIQNGPSLTETQGRDIGLLYIKKVLELDPEKAGWEETVAALEYISSNEQNIREFWEEANKIAPNLVRSDDLEYIVKVDASGKDVGFKMIGAIVLGPSGYKHSLLSGIFYGARP